MAKHHYEVFQDEGADSRLDELTTTTLKPQTEAAGDFDIEWGQATRDRPFMTERKLNQFEEMAELLTILILKDPSLNNRTPKNWTG